MNENPDPSHPHIQKVLQSTHVLFLQNIIFTSSTHARLARAIMMSSMYIVRHMRAPLYSV